MLYRRTFVAARVGIVALATAISVAACGSGSAAPASTPPGTTSGSPSPATASSATHPNAGLRTGTELRAALPTGADLPKGFHVPAGGPQDSGAGFGADLTASSLGHPDCPQLESGNAWVGLLGQPAAFAQTEFDDSYGDQVFPEVDAYRGTEATSVMAAYRRLFAACRTFMYDQSGTHAHVTLKVHPGPTVGDESIRAVLTSPSFQGGATIVAVRVGQFVVTVYDNSTSKDLGAGAVGLAAAMARRL